MFRQLFSFSAFYTQSQFFSLLSRVGAPLRSDFDYTSVGCLLKNISNKYPMQFKAHLPLSVLKPKIYRFEQRKTYSKESSQ
jgi:hypothetical protein